MKEHLLSPTFSQNFIKAITSFFIVLSLLSLNNQTAFAQNYGLRDDGGANLPTLTYWYSGQSGDITEKGSEFNYKALGELTALYIKGANIKSWKSVGGDVTGATFSYKIWESSASEPSIYTERAVNWSSNDGDGNQSWADFGAEIEVTLGLAPGNYNFKLFFSISGSGLPGTTEDGPFTASFFVPEPASSDAEILTFSLTEQTGAAVINSAAATVAIEVENGTALANLTPTITVSENANISPAGGTAQDFSTPFDYTVTAEDLTEKVWTVTVTEAAPPAPNYGLRDDGGTNLPTITYWYSGHSGDITEKGSEFNYKALGELTALYIKGANIKSWKSVGGDVTGATFSYKIWESSASEPSIYTERAVNWSSNDGDGNQSWADFGTEIEATLGLAPGNYNFKLFISISGSGLPGTTEDGPFTASFFVPEPASSDAEILTFSLTEQTGAAVINPAAATVAIEVENGTALANLTPTITVSENANISPAGGTAQDFSTPFDYTVTAEDLTEKVWTVTVTEAAPPAPNYGLRDDGGTNLPTITYWYSGHSGDITEKGSEFNYKALGELTALYIKGANIKSWKSAGGDVTGATFSYKIWESSASEPSIYTERAVNWSSNDGDGNQSWADFGTEIEATLGLAPGNYNFKLFFSISGSGLPGTTEDGPFTASFFVPEPASSDAEILTFSLTEQTGAAVINPAAATVAIEVENGTALANLTPTITVSENANISPAGGTAQDFSAPFDYTVTAEDLTEKVWTVTVTEAALPAPNYGLRDDGGTNLPTITYYYSGQAGDITEKGSEFDTKSLGELTALYIKGANIKSWKSAGGDVSGAKFSYKIWESSASEPSIYTERAVNWSSNDGDGNQSWADFGAEIEATSGLAPGDYNFKIFFSISGSGLPGTTEDGPFTASFFVPEPASSDAEILTFSLTEQTGAAVINSAAATVAIEVENGTALTNLTPTISLSANATISPAGGTAQDFSTPFDYTVTAEDLTEKVWTVTVTEAAPPTALTLPYSNGLRTLSAYNQLLTDGFTVENSDYITAAGGYIKIFNGGYVETPLIDFTAYGILEISFSSTTFGGVAGQTMAIEISENGGGSYTQLTTYTLTSSYSSYEYLLDLSGYPSQTGKLRFKMISGTNATRFRDLSLEESIPDPEIGFANLQYPASGAIEPLQEFNVYAQAWIENTTGSGTATAGLQSWIGYSTDNTNPNTWTNWIEADFQGINGNNDEFFANLGGEMTSEGVFYYASRFKYLSQDYVYGGFNGGFWDGVDNVSGVLTVAEVIETYPVLFTVTDGTESYSAIEIKGSMTDWATLAMTENPDHVWTISLDIPAGTYEWGAIENDGSDDGIWLIEGGNLSFVVSETGVITGTVSYTIPALPADPEIGFANLQYPASGAIEPLQEFNVYAQAYIDGITGSGTATAGLQSWIGYSTDNTNPNTWTNWIEADFQGVNGNNDEFFANLGAEMTTEGVFYYASRFKYLSQDYVYGGFNGGFWDGVDNVSGVLTVTEVIVTYPVLFTVTDGTESYSAIEIKGSMTDWATLAMTENPDHVWTISLDIPAGTYEWGAIENDGSDDGIWLIDGGNLSFVVSETGVITGTVSYTIPALPADPEIGFANLQYPASGAIEPLQEFNVYAQAWIENTTGSGTATAGLQSWIGYSTDNTNPNTWTNWIEADFQGVNGNNDEFFANLGAEMTTEGVFYYASRFKYLSQDYVYGGFNGGFWDGVDNVSGVLTVTEVIVTYPVLFTVTDGTESYQAIEIKGSMTDWATLAMTENPDHVWTISLDIPAGTYEWGAIENDGSDDGIWLIDGGNLSFVVSETGVITGTVSYTIPALPADPEIGFANLQYPASGAIEPLQEFNVYAQAWIENTTGSGTATADLQAWIGYSTDNTNPNTWTNWIEADFQGINGNNDEFFANLGAEMATEGIFYYASRFKYLNQDYVYGGFNGGFWDGVDNVSGVLTVTEETTDPVIGFANLQWPASGTIEPLQEFNVYAQAWIENTTGSGTATADLQAWIGYSTDNTNPNTWTNWIEADFQGTNGNNDEFFANLGGEMTSEGTFYYASRFKYLEQDYVYGGFNSGFWDGVDNVSGVLTVTTTPPDPEITFANLQFPASASILIGGNVDVYAQVEASGVALDENGYDGLTVWIGYSSNDTDPTGWTNWYAATYNGISGFTNRPEYLGEIGSDIAQAGTYYYASRFQLSGGNFVYGGFDGGFWDGVNNVSGVLTVTEETTDPVIGFANLQWPASGTIEPLQEFNVYAQAWIENTTGSGTATADLQSWIGYSTDNTNPNTWTNWIEADFQGINGNNDEFFANLGGEMTSEGTFYYASRFKYLEQDYVYGGFDGGFWDGVDNVSGVLTVTEVIVTYPVLFTVTDGTESYQTIEIKGSMTDWATLAMTENPDHVWTISLDIPAGTYEWGAIENDGSDDGIWLIDGGNLSFVVSETGVITGTVSYTIPALPADPEIGFANLQYPASGAIEPLQEFNVYAQAWIENTTGSGTATADLQSWIGYSTDNTNPNTWTNWIEADFQGINGNNDEFYANLGAEMTTEGTFYYASRFKYLEQDYVYGGFDGGFWDGMDNVSGVLTVTEETTDPVIGFANLQWPASGTIEPLQEFNVYAQAYIDGVTGSGTTTADLQSWIGYSTDNTNPNTWTNWIEADFQGINGNNDEFFANLGGEMTSEGTFYYASRFKYLEQDYVYGGFNGGFWDGVDNVSGVLTVAEVIETYPVLFTVTDGTESYSAIEIKGSMTDWATLAMTESPDHVWTISLDIPAGTYEWGAIENDGSDDGIWLIEGGNLSFVVSETGVITGTVSYTIPALPADSEIGFANLQYPASGAIEPLQEFNVYAQAWIENTTGSGTATADLQAWIGYSTDNTNPNTWTNWIEADFQGINGNNDEFFANLGGEMTSEGTFYYASRFKYLEQDYVYGGFNGGFWDGVDNVSGVLTVTEETTDPVIGFANLQWPASGTIEPLQEFNVYAQAWIENTTGSGTATADLQAWIGYSTDNTNPNTWTNWIEADFQGINGNNDEFFANLGGEMTSEGTFYYASRFKYLEQDYVYGGFNGGFWDGVDNVSGVLTVTEETTDPVIGFANLQWPASGTIEPLQEFNVYAQAWIENTTGSGTATAGLQSWIGYSTDNTNPNTWTNWIEADFQGVNGNNDEFFANLGAEMTTEGVFYYASRFMYLSQDYVYGGFNGGFWDGVDNVSGVLTVAEVIETYPVLFTVTDGTESYSAIEIKGSKTDWATLAMTENPDHVWTISLDIPAGTYEWGAIENDGSDDGIWLIEGGNLSFVVSETGVITGTVSYTIPALPADPEIGFANLQYPASGAIEPLQEFNVYAQAWIENTTGSGTATAGLQSWIGYSTDNTNPNTWTNWIEADFQGTNGNNDEFFANLGGEMTSEGTFYYASRFKYLEQDYVYGGFDGGFWDGVDNVSGVLTVTEVIVTYPVLFTVTDGTESYQTIEIKGSMTDWATLAMTENPDHVWTISLDIPAGTYEWGAIENDGSDDGIWLIDGGNLSFVVSETGVITGTVSYTIPALPADPEIGFANLQYPASGAIEPLQEFNVYAQAWIENTTGSGTATAGLQSWIGYSTDNTNPNTWTNWIEADFQGINGNNDEFFANLGGEMTSEGVFYYASRFKYLSQDYVYGGFNGGFWDGVDNVSGVLTVAEVIETYPVLFTVTDGTESYSAIEIKGSMTDWATLAMTENPDHVWTISLDIPAGTYEWGAIENDGSDDGIWLIEGGNLSFVVSETGEITGTVSYTIPAAADPEIAFANLQWPASGTIEPLQEFNVYAQAYIDGKTGSGTATADLQTWIGYSTDNTNPNTWTNWIEADFQGINGNNDEFFANLGGEMTSEGTFYYASRFKYLEQDYVYGGFNGGFWDGVDNVSGVLTVTTTPPDPEITFANLQFPASASILISESLEVYAQVEASGVALDENGYDGMTVWIGYSSNDTDPTGWTNWYAATYNGISGFTNRPEYLGEIGSDIAQAGTYYYASRFQLSGGNFVYGGFDGGFWDGVNNVSGVLTVTEETTDPVIGFANLQWPASGTIEPLQEFNVYAQAWIENTTGSGTATADLQSWIGYSTDNTNPNTWTNWIEADFQGINGNNDEFFANLGGEMTSEGTFYYASRFKYLSQDYVYGGFNGGFWDGVDNVSGVLTVTEVIVTYPVLFTVTDGTESYSAIEIKGSMTDWATLAMTESPDHVWTISLDIPAGTYEWGAIENDGSDDGIWLIEGGNLSFVVSETGVITGTVSYTIPALPADPEIGFTNLQYPASGAIEPLQEFNVYAQAWIENTTGSGTATADLQSWIGYSTDNTNPNTWTNWIEADFQGINGNNDEFFANLGAEMTSEGTFYYASRFKYLEQDYVYGGFDGGFWDGVDNVSGVLTVAEVIETYPVLFTVTDGTESYSAIEIKGSMTDWATLAMTENPDHVWTISLDIPAGTYEWGAIENDGSDDGIWLIEGGNLSFVVSETGVITGTVSYTIPALPAEPEIGFANLQYPASGAIEPLQEFNVYAQAWIENTTGSGTATAGLQAWIGYSTDNTNPNTWTNWIEADFQGVNGNNDEFFANLGAEMTTEGVFYYASRFKYLSQDYVYGGFNGGFWDGVNNVSGVLTVTEETTDPVIGFANLQWPASGTIEPLQEFNVYAQAWIENTTGSGTATADLQAWIGYSTDNTNPNTWTNWIEADFQGINGNNDEFFANLGAEMTTEGTFYYASRFKYLEQDYVYGGFNGGFWDGVDNVSGVLTVTTTPPDPEITFANLQFPASASILIGGNVDVYAQVEASGVALDENGYDGLTVWIGYSSNDTDPTGWTNWYATTYNGISGFTNRPEYLGEIGSDIAQAGTYYYASRFQLSGGNFVYGGFDGGFWDGVNNVSGVLTVTEETTDPVIGFANLQWPASGTIEPLQEFNVYAQAWIENTTGSGTATADLQSWIGYSTDNTNPNTWTNWIEADFQGINGNNDEFFANLGGEMTSEGTFYYASRFKYLSQDYVYGGFNGGFWDGVDNVSGVLTVTTTPPDPEITFANLQFPASASILIGGNVDVYAQVEASGVALDENGYDGLTVWIGYSSNDTDPTGWTNWYATTYNGISGFTNRPEYLGEIGSDIAQAGIYYYASRFQLSGGNFVYGGFDGGFWDGVNNVSGVLTVTEETPELEIGWANLQWPPAGLIEPGDEFIVYAQAWIQNTTGSGTATENLQSWIGYSTDNTDPATWTNWIEADYNAAVGSNDEFMANLGAELSAEGTYYYASRFQYLDQAFVYGGFSEAGGGFWDGVDYVSGQLVVVNEVVLYPITFTATDATGLYSNIKFKGEMTNWETVPMEQNGENWTLSFDILPGTYEWGLIEDDGSPDGIWLIEGPNLEVSISAEGVITGDTTYVITYVGLEEMQADVKIYPNPTKNRLYLEFSQAGDFELQLFDTKGQLINRLQSAETRLMLPVQNLEPGMYVIRIISDKALITKTFIKQ